MPDDNNEWRRRYDSAHDRDDFPAMDRLNEAWDAAIDELEAAHGDRNYTDHDIAALAIRQLDGGAR